MPIKILFVGSNPSDTENIGVDAEFRDVQQEIASSDNRDQLNLEYLPAPRPTDLSRRLNEFQPDIVHFTGHGTESGAFVISAPDDSNNELSAKQMKELFVALNRQFKILFFNYCFSQLQAAVMAEFSICRIFAEKKHRCLCLERFCCRVLPGIGCWRLNTESI